MAVAGARSTFHKAGAPWQLECEQLEQRCGYLLTSGLWSDCIFMVGSETNLESVEAHKLFLAMASPVFEGMFYGSLSERNDPIISVPDVKPETFRALLHYIYTGNTNIGSFDMAIDLWYGANKYILPHLEKQCYGYICSVLGPSNACRAYEFAHFLNEKALMDKCLQIMSTKTKEVLNDTSFEDVELNTIMTVFSLDYLNVDSELDLFHAVARYAKAEQRTQGQISPLDEGPPSKKLCTSLQNPSTSEEKAFLLSVEGSSTAHHCTSPGALHRPGTEGPSIRRAIQKIRFLTLTPAQFADGPARSGLLTEAESYAVLMNIASGDSAVPMPTGFSESRESRKPYSYSVDEEPFAMPLPKPSTKSCGVAATNLLTPADVVRDLLSDEQKTLELATSAARHMTCADADGTSENLTQLVAAGGIPLLVDALSHSSDAVKCDAAWAITNIACDGGHVEALLNCGAVPALVAHIGCGGAVAAQAAWALGNIAAGGDAARDAAIDAKVVPALLAHMLPSTPSARLVTYLRTYRMICQKKSEACYTPSRFELVSSALPYIENLLVLADEQVLAESCWVIYHLADGERLKLPLFTSSLASRLTALLRPAAAPRVQAAALRAVANMLRIDGLTKLCVGAGCLDHIINILKCGNPSHVQYAANAAVNAINTAPDIQQALDKGILDALVPALTQGNDECKFHAALAINSLCGRRSPCSASRMLAASTALQPYCQLLVAGPYLCGLALSGITQLLKYVERNSKDALILKLRKIGVPQLLKTAVQQAEDSFDSDAANRLLRKYFHIGQ